MERSGLVRLAAASLARADSRPSSWRGLEVDFAAHAAIKNKDGVLDLNRASQRGGVGAFASQDGDVERGAMSADGEFSSKAHK
jgi:hypothetical protein